jgi:hypothetical protein
MSDHLIVNGISAPPAHEQDKLIASVVLAGWVIVQKASFDSGSKYQVSDPQGYVVGYRATRYGAALLAERYLHEPALADLMPEALRVT